MEVAQTKSRRSTENGFTLGQEDPDIDTSCRRQKSATTTRASRRSHGQITVLSLKGISSNKIDTCISTANKTEMFLNLRVRSPIRLDTSSTAVQQSTGAVTRSVDRTTYSDKD
jgi:hypothetical protein